MNPLGYPAPKRKTETQIPTEEKWARGLRAVAAAALEGRPTNKVNGDLDTPTAS
jgi:hypothetical protein